MELTWCIIAAAIAAIAATVELLSRYRDDPRATILNPMALSYILLNSFIAILATWWLLLSRYDFVMADNGALDPVALVIAGSFGSLAVMRLTFVKIHTDNGEEVSVGPAMVIERLLTIVDREIDRHLASNRAEIARTYASRFTFERDAENIVAAALVLMQNPSPTETGKVTAVTQALRGNDSLSDDIRNLSLVLALFSVVGRKVVEEAIRTVCKDNPADDPGLPALTSTSGPE